MWRADESLARPLKMKRRAGRRAPISASPPLRILASSIARATNKACAQSLRSTFIPSLDPYRKIKSDTQLSLLAPSAAEK